MKSVASHRLNNTGQETINLDFNDSTCTGNAASRKPVSSNRPGRRASRKSGADMRQYGLDALLQDADATNHQQKVDRELAHLPSTMPEGLAYLHALLDRYHTAILASDADTADGLAEDALRLAVKLNGGTNFGMAKDEEAPARVLARETAAPPDTAPLWGQQGEFTIKVRSIPIRIRMRGLYDIGGGGFEAHVIDRGMPFISDTGYRSFLGLYGNPLGLTVEDYCRKVIEAHIDRELKGKLCRLQDRGGRSL